MFTPYGPEPFLHFNYGPVYSAITFIITKDNKVIHILFFKEQTMLSFHDIKSGSKVVSVFFSYRYSKLIIELTCR